MQTQTKTKTCADQDYQLWVILRQTSDAIRRAREYELRQSGVSRMQAAVLFAVKTMEDPITPARLSRWLFRKAHTVSGLLDRMEKRGLITKTNDLDKKNLVRVALTKDGEAAYLRSMTRNSLHTVIASLSPEEREELRNGLQKLRNKALGELRIESPLPFP